jgi:hypothetical protein
VEIKQGVNMNGLLVSRKFWLAISDVLFSVIIYFVGKYALPEVGNDILYVIGLIQPVIITLISSIAKEDAALKSANG